MRGLQCSPILIPRSMASVSLPFNRLPALLIPQVSIRAYGAQQAFRQESFTRIDTTLVLHVHPGMWTDGSGSAWIFWVLFSLPCSLIIKCMSSSVSAATTWFSLNMAFSFCMFILYLILIYNNFEVECNRWDVLHWRRFYQELTVMNNLERIQRYLDIDHEPKSTETGKHPASWPTSGDMRVENLSACYSQVRSQENKKVSCPFFSFILVRSQSLAQPIFPC